MAGLINNKANLSPRLGFGWGLGLSLANVDNENCKIMMKKLLTTLLLGMKGKLLCFLRCSTTTTLITANLVIRQLWIGLN